MRGLLTSILAVPFLMAADRPTSGASDDFEGVRLWDVAPWLSSASEAVYTNSPGEGHGMALRCSFANAKREIRSWHGIEYNGVASYACCRHFDFTDVSAVQVDVYKGPVGLWQHWRNQLQVSLGVQAGFEGEFFEFPCQWVGERNGWHTLEFRVDEHLKSSASIWRHNDELRDKSRVAALILNFWGGDGPVWIDNTRLRGGSTPALATRPAGIPRELSELSQELKWYCSIVDTDKSLLPRARRIKRESVASYAGVRLRLGESRPDVEIVSETELIAVGDFDLRSACRIVINATNGSTTPAVVRLRISGGSAQKEVQTLGHYLPPNAGRVLEFDLCCASLRSEGTGWLPASGMPFRDKVNEVAVRVSRPEGVVAPVDVLIQNFHVLIANGSAQPAAPPTNAEPLPDSQAIPAFAGPVDVRVRDLPVPKGGPPWEATELVFNLVPAVRNPYDPDQASVDVRFEEPGTGKTYDVPAFFCDKDRGWKHGEGERPREGGCWKARFTPSRTGLWKYRITAQMGDRRGSTAGTFSCRSVGRQGFVGVRNGTFNHVMGGTFFPVGVNLPWLRMATASGYPEHLKSLQGLGVNLVRVWNAQWGNLVEWSPPRGSGLGRYSEADANAFDDIFQAAEASGVFVQFVLNHHRMFRFHDGWEENPYNELQGGPCANTNLIEFFSGTDARRIHTHKLRYVVARWGYSPNLFAWELFNEIDLVDGYKSSGVMSEAVTNWVQMMAGELRRLDSFTHLVTVSNEAMQSEPALAETCDFTQTHLYTRYPEGPILAFREKHGQKDKPHLVTELGGPQVETDQNGFPLEVETDVLHRGLWAAVMTGSPGTPMPWWWMEMLAEEAAGAKADSGRKRIERAYATAGVARELLAIAEFRRSIPELSALHAPLEVKNCGFVTPGAGLDAGKADLAVSFSLGWELPNQRPFPLRATFSPPSFLIPKYLPGRESKARRDLPGVETVADFPYPLEFAFSNAWHGVVTAQLLARSNTNSALRLLNALNHDEVWSYTAELGHPRGLDIQMNTIISNETIVSSGGSLLFENAGADWVRCSCLSFSDFAPRFQVMGRTDHASMVAWILDRDGAGSANKDCRAEFETGAAGVYRVSFFDCTRGVWDPEERTATSIEGRLSIDLPTFRREIALRAVRTTGL